MFCVRKCLVGNSSFLVSCIAKERCQRATRLPDITSKQMDSTMHNQMYLTKHAYIVEVMEF
jgi:hypothetical protein